MIVIKFVTSYQYKTNTYLVYSRQTKKGIVIDPGHHCSDVIKFVENEKIDVEYIVNTHAHHDHCAGNQALITQLHAGYLIGRQDAELLKALVRTGMVVLQTEPSFYVSGGDRIGVDGLEFRIMETPGHTEGSITICCENALFLGDLIICVGNARDPYDATMITNSKICRSIQHQILPQINEQTRLYPGHGPVLMPAVVQQLASTRRGGSD